MALASDSEPEPDLSVVPGNPMDYWDAHPATALLLVEVSDTTLEHDRRRKGSLYARANIQDYWIVNIIDRCVEVYREPHEGVYRSCQQCFPGADLSPLSAPKARISVADFFRRD